MFFPHIFIVRKNIREEKILGIPPESSLIENRNSVTPGEKPISYFGFKKPNGSNLLDDRSPAKQLLGQNIYDFCGWGW